MRFLFELLGLLLRVEPVRINYAGTGMLRKMGPFVTRAEPFVLLPRLRLGSKVSQAPAL